MPLRSFRRRCAAALALACLASSAACGDDRTTTTEPEDDGPPAIPAAADTCGDADTALPPGYTVTATTVGATHDYVACNDAAYGPDVAFRLLLEEPAGVSIVVTGEEGFDPVVYVMQPGCDTLVANGCSDLTGNIERLEISQLGRGEYFIIVDAADVAGSRDAGAFDIRVEVIEGGTCADDEIDRAGYGDTARLAASLGAFDVDTATSGPVLTSCADDEDFYLLGHLGGDIDVRVEGTGVVAELYAATPVTEAGEPVVDGDVVVEQGALVSTLPLTSATSAGMYLVRVRPGASIGRLGADYTISVNHSCLPDAYDHPLPELDDAVPARAYTVLDANQPMTAQSRSLCGDDADAYLLWLTATGELVIEVQNGANFTADLYSLDAFDGTVTPLSPTLSSAGDDLTVTADVTEPGTYALVLSSGPASTTSYHVAGTFPGTPGTCILADTLSDASGQIAGTTLGSPDRVNPLQMHTGSTCTGGEAPGPEAIYAIDIAENDVVDFELEAHFDAALYVLDACATANICFVGADADFREDDNVETLSLPGFGATVFVVVDSFDPLARGRFTLNWSTRTLSLPECGNGALEQGETCDDGQSPPLPGDGCDHQCTIELGYICPDAGSACVALSENVGADTCSDPAVSLPLPSEVGGQTGLLVEDPHQSATDALTGSCGGDFGPELIYAFTTTGSGRYRITSAGADTFLYVYTGTCGDPGAEVACNDDASGMAGGSEVELDTVAEQTYYLVLDFFSSNPGGAQVVVERLL